MPPFCHIIALIATSASSSVSYTMHHFGKKGEKLKSFFQTQCTTILNQKKTYDKIKPKFFEDQKLNI